MTYRHPHHTPDSGQRTGNTGLVAPPALTDRRFPTSPWGKRG
jgi:hypothetical protein